MTDRIYIPHLREGSDDCWDGFTWRGWQHTRERQRVRPPRPAPSFIGASDRDVLDSLVEGE